jgi:uncharacterized RDD family membrane protein YckC/Tfp pilus assembly major pilin PilA
MYCFKCGAVIQDASNFCPKCGARVSAPVAEASPQIEPPSLPQAEPIGSSAVSTPPVPPSGELPRYAGFWRRVVAAVIDGFVQSLLSIVLVFALIFAASSSNATVDENSLAGAYYLLSWIVGWMYYALMHSSSWQATLGKRALGIKVTTLGGERIGFGRATGRFFAAILSALLLGIGYLMAAFTVRKQALHDLIAGTLVVTRDATPAAVAAGLAPPRVSGGLVAAAVLVGLIPVAGVLAAIAIPAYQDYMLRSQVGEGLVEASAYKMAVMEAIADGHDPSTIDNAMLGLTDTPTSHYLTSIDVEGAAIQLTYGGEAGSALQQRMLTLAPGLMSTGEVVWACGYADMPAGAAPLLDDYTEYNSVEPKYLPYQCR